MFRLGYAIGPVVGVLLWTYIGKGVWLVCAVVGVLITGPGIWSLRQPGPADGPEPAADAVSAELAPPDAAPTDTTSAEIASAEIAPATMTPAEIPPSELPPSDTGVSADKVDHDLS